MSPQELCDELAMIDDEIVELAGSEPTYRGCSKARSLQEERADIIDRLRSVGSNVVPIKSKVAA